MSAELIDVFVTLGNNLVGCFAEQVEQFELHIILRVACGVAADFVHLGLESVVCHVFAAEKSTLHVYVENGFRHIGLAKLKQVHAALVVIHLVEPIEIIVEELLVERFEELRVEELACDFGGVLGEALTYVAAQASAQI